MSTLKKPLYAVRNGIYEGIKHLFTVHISFEEARHRYTKYLIKKDSGYSDIDWLKEDWENVGRDIQKSIDRCAQLIEEDQVKPIQYRLKFDDEINGRGKREEGSREKHPA